MTKAFFPFSFVGIAAAVLSMLANAPMIKAQNGKVMMPGFMFETVITGMSHATDIEFLPDNRLLVLNRAGEIHLYNQDLQYQHKAFDISDRVCPNCSERGALSITLHPNFVNNGWLYVFWVHTSLDRNSCECEIWEVENNINAPAIRMSRFTFDGQNIDEGSELVLFESTPVGRMHNGGDAAFGDDGYLYVTTGDGHYPTNGDNPSTNTNNLLGKLLRLTDTGEPVSDNPYMNDPTSIRCNNRRLLMAGGKGTKCQEIFHLGLRNPFGLSKDPTVPHFRAMIQDIGSATWEELSIVEAGTGFPQKHYGWPWKEGPCALNQKAAGQCAIDARYEEPVHFYDRPGPEGQRGAAITAGTFIPEGVWPPEFDGQYFYADMRRGRIYWMKYDPDNECRGTQCGEQTSQYELITIIEDENLGRTFPLGSPLRMRFGVPRNAMYVIGYDNGRLYRLTHTAEVNRYPVAVIGEHLFSNTEDGLTVAFDGTDSSDPDDDELEYEWNFGDVAESVAVGGVVTHSYTLPGTYTVTLTVDDGKGGKSVDSMQITVHNDHEDLEEFPWEYGDQCPDGYDACGILEFCNQGTIFGYRLPTCDGTCIPGRAPVIRMEPGKKYQFILNNVAPEGTAPTNVHTHGLHIVGSGDADNVLREVSGGNCLDYTWDIPREHPGGTYWYHSHIHEGSLEQTNGGAYGLLIIEDNQYLNDDIPDWAANELLLQVSANMEEHIMANGYPYEIFEIEANQWYRLRVSTVDPMAVPRDLTFTDACEVHKVASDGVWHSTVPGAFGDTFPMTGASRADFAIRCPFIGSNANILWHGKVVAIVNAGSMESNPYIMEEWNPTRPQAMQGIAEAVVPVENQFSITIERESINFVSWDPFVPLNTIAYDQVHEWEIGDSEGHPFHTHLYHMMVVTPGGCGAHKEGEFYDTISGPPCTVRFKTADIGQMMVMHCHVMTHGDAGAMAWVNVTGEGMPTNEVMVPEYTCSYRDRLSCPPTMSPTQSPTHSDPVLILPEREYITTDQYRVSEPPGLYLHQQNDGELVLHRGTPGNSRMVLWSSGFKGPVGEYYSELQGNGVLLTRDQTPAIKGAMQWRADATGIPEAGFYFEFDPSLNEVLVQQGEFGAPVLTIWADAVNTDAPTISPTQSPSLSPTEVPSAAPSASPAPSSSPSASPTTSPSASPTASPTASPSASPTYKIDFNDPPEPEDEWTLSNGGLIDSITAGDPFCESGKRTTTFCCPSHCEDCNGQSCVAQEARSFAKSLTAQEEESYMECCSSGIVLLGRDCASVGPPCIVTTVSKPWDDDDLVAPDWVIDRNGTKWRSGGRPTTTKTWMTIVTTAVFMAVVVLM